jgi:hypothetical protein
MFESAVRGATRGTDAPSTPRSSLVSGGLTRVCSQSSCGSDRGRTRKTAGRRALTAPQTAKGVNLAKAIEMPIGYRRPPLGQGTGMRFSRLPFGRSRTWKRFAALRLAVRGFVRAHRLAARRDKGHTLRWPTPGLGTVEIGEPERTYTVEPLEDPVPRERPGEPAEQPAGPTPAEEPIEPESVPAP